MLSLTLIFRNFHLAARGADRWRQVPQPTPQPSEFVSLTAGTSRIEPSVPRETTKVSREGLVSALLAATEKAARRDPISRRRRGSSAGPMVRIRLTSRRPERRTVEPAHPWRIALAQARLHLGRLARGVNDVASFFTLSKRKGLPHLSSAARFIE